MTNFIVIDGNSLIHRAFYAMPPMKTKTGTPTGAVYGFLVMLFNLIDTYNPSHLLVAFDRKEKTFRHKMFDEYKAGRRKTPDDLIAQFPVLQEILDEIGVKRADLSGYEADDILGTVSKRFSNELTVHLVTGDRDSLQLIGKNVDVLMTRKGTSDIETFDEAHLKEVYGLVPSQIVDLKSLMGDSSDNIPGIPGIGEKTALKLLSDFSTLEGVYEHLDELPKNKLYEKLTGGKDSAELSYKLATIDREIPLEGDLNDFSFDGFAQEGLLGALSKYEFSSLLKRFSIENKPKTQKEAEILNICDADALTNLESLIREKSVLSLLTQNDELYVTAEEGKDYKIEIDTSLFASGLSVEAVKEFLERLFSLNTLEIITYDSKSLRYFLRKLDVQAYEPSFDIMLAAYVLNPTKRNYSLENLRMFYEESGMACAALTIARRQKEELTKNGLDRVFYEIELPLESVLYDMEREGFSVDTASLEALSKEYALEIESLTAKIHEYAGEEFNIASTKALGRILFEKLELPVIKKTKSGYSTDIEVLEKLEDRHPIIPLIINYRQLTKLKSTYIDGFLPLVDPKTHKVHSTFNQVTTATGRISSTEPNLQNIPVRSETGKDIRKAFIPSDDDHIIVSGDYSQIELRILAHISEDENMCDAFNRGQDIHLRTASEVFGVPSEMVTGEMRSSAKAVNFGIVYGISDFGLGRNLGISRFRAGEYIKRYLEEFSGVHNYMENIKKEAREKGYVRTLFGRIRYIDELSSSNYNMCSFGERIAMNTPIQGTAADIIKIAMIRVNRALKENGLSSKLVLQVHDELIVDTLVSEKDEVIRLLKDSMETILPMKVPLTVNISFGSNWAEAK